MTLWKENKKVDDFDIMFNYYYDLIHERYRKFWNYYFRITFGIYDIFTEVESPTLEDLR